MTSSAIAERFALAISSSNAAGLPSSAFSSCAARKISVYTDASRTRSSNCVSGFSVHANSVLTAETFQFGFKGAFGTHCPKMILVQAPHMGTRYRQRTVILRATAGSAVMLAKEMERVAAKEALLLSIKDAGGLKGLGNAAEDDKARIDVNEKVLDLERLNPTPRPTTSPDLEGLWQFEWAAARSPAVIAASTILGNFPSALASINSLTLLVLDGSTTATGRIEILNAVESRFTLVTKLTIEGPVRLKEEYVEGLLSSPTVPEGGSASPLTGVFRQMFNLAAQLPSAVRNIVGGGLRLPLSGTYSRELLISYLDDEVLVARDKSGAPDVLQRVVTNMT